MKKFWKSWYLRPHAAVAVAACALPAIIAEAVPAVIIVAYVMLLGVVAAIVVDTMMLFSRRMHISARRELEYRLSNGDINPVRLYVSNASDFKLRFTIIDEVPIQFQVRDCQFMFELEAGASTVRSYTIRPSKRGAYSFGKLNVYAYGLGLVERRFVFDADFEACVYPSIIQMRKTALEANKVVTDRVGSRKQPRVGVSREFEKIKQYVSGDDVRSINWQATARTSELMVNQYQEERSQDIYSILDAGRVMKMPFDGLTLLDHSINAIVAFSNVVLRKDDRAGLIAYSHNRRLAVPASGRYGHLETINNKLYNLETDFAESNDALLLATVTSYVKQRSFLMMYTNIESMTSLRRRLPILKQIARKHQLVVVMFANREMRDFASKESQNLRDIYVSTIARGIDVGKQEIRQELRKHGILSMLTTPDQLTSETVNAYIKHKRTGSI